MRSFLGDLFLTSRPFRVAGALVVVFVVGYFAPAMVTVGQIGVALLLTLLAADVLLLWRTLPGGLAGTRRVADKLSMGDDNVVTLEVASRYPFRAAVGVIDEMPEQFQKRDQAETVLLEPRGTRTLRYTLRPTERGAYDFGALVLYAASPLGLVQRRFRTAEPKEVKVYPSVIQMRRYAFLAENDRLQEVGIKRVRRRGQTMEFDRIREYVPGDERRTINWKATARRGGELMVNQYQEERAQPVVAALDMGRSMRSPFEGLTLLDHAVNASLVLLNTALLKYDKAGLVTFGTDVRTVLPPDRSRGQLRQILEALYRQETDFRDPNDEAFYAAVRERLRRRALLLLFSNVDTRTGLERRLPYWRRIAKRHRLVVIFFENTGLREVIATPAERLEEVYTRAVAEGLAMEKREIARTLERHGVGSLLTTPQALTVNAVNRYLQLKARGPF